MDYPTESCGGEKQRGRTGESAFAESAEGSCSISARIPALRDQSLLIDISGESEWNRVFLRLRSILRRFFV